MTTYCLCEAEGRGSQCWVGYASLQDGLPRRYAPRNDRVGSTMTAWGASYQRGVRDNFLISSTFA